MIHVKVLLGICFVFQFESKIAYIIVSFCFTAAVLQIMTFRFFLDFTSRKNCQFKQIFQVSLPIF